MSGCALALPRTLEPRRGAGRHTSHTSRPSHPSSPRPATPSPSTGASSATRTSSSRQKTAILGRSFECAAQFPRNSRAILRNYAHPRNSCAILRPPSRRVPHLRLEVCVARRRGLRELLPSTPLSEASAAAGRIVVVVLSGLRLDALTKHAGLKGWVDGEVAAKRVGSGMVHAAHDDAKPLAAGVGRAVDRRPARGARPPRQPRPSGAHVPRCLIDVGAQRVGGVGGDAVVCRPRAVEGRHCR